MNHKFAYVAILLTIGSGTAIAQTDKSALVNEHGILPTFKAGLRVAPSERNPYAKRIVEEEEQVDAESEAAQILKLLSTLRIHGFSRDEKGNVKTVLCGDLRFTEGAAVPQLLPEQNDRLIVSRVTNHEVELSWRTENGRKSGDGRKLIIPFNLEPKIQINLPGRADNESPVRAWIVKDGAPSKDNSKPKKNLLPTSG